MAVHYFIGIPVPLSLAKQLIASRDEWKLSGFKRYPAPEDLHLTLSFIGAAEKSEADRMIQLLRSVEAGAFELIINKTETFGPEEKPRVVFAAVEENQALRKLQHQVLNALEPLDLKLDTKPFHPHITLANKRASDDPLPKAMPLATVQFEVRQFCVYRIQPQQTPRYIEVASIPLSLRENR